MTTFEYPKCQQTCISCLRTGECGLWTAKHTQGPWPVTSEDRLMKRGGVGGGQRDEQGTQAVGGAEGD